MRSTSIKHAISQFPLEKFPGVHSIVVHKKTKDGVMSDDAAVVFGVYEKLNVDAIPPGQLLPEMIQVDDEQILTDVVQDETDWKFENTCQSVTSQDLDDHRMRHRPLVGGVSIGVDVDQHKNSVATFG